MDNNWTIVTVIGYGNDWSNSFPITLLPALVMYHKRQRMTTRMATRLPLGITTLDSHCDGHSGRGHNAGLIPVFRSYGCHSFIDCKRVLKWLSIQSLFLLTFTTLSVQKSLQYISLICTQKILSMKLRSKRIEWDLSMGLAYQSDYPSSVIMVNRGLMASVGSTQPLLIKYIDESTVVYLAISWMTWGKL